MKKVLIGVLVAVVLIQFIRIDKTPPESDPGQDLMMIVSLPEDVKLNLKSACYDCHSNNTKYPWYSNIAPVSWWLQNHVKHGRGNMNFSTWGEYDADKQRHKLEECVEMLEKGWMPLGSYARMHEEARLDENERKAMIEAFDALIKE